MQSIVCVTKDWKDNWDINELFELNKTHPFRTENINTESDSNVMMFSTDEKALEFAQEVFNQIFDRTILKEDKIEFHKAKELLEFGKKLEDVLDGAGDDDEEIDDNMDNYIDEIFAQIKAEVWFK